MAFALPPVHCDHAEVVIEDLHYDRRATERYALDIRFRCPDCQRTVLHFRENPPPEAVQKAVAAFQSYQRLPLARIVADDWP